MDEVMACWESWFAQAQETNDATSLAGLAPMLTSRHRARLHSGGAVSGKCDFGHCQTACEAAV